MATASLASLTRYLQTVGPAEPDAALLARFARSADEAAFAELVRRHGPAVLGVCRRVLRDAHAADDAFQATFLLLAKKAAGLRSPERLGGWLYAVAYRTAAKLRGRLARRREHPFDETDFVPAEKPNAAIGPELDAAIQQLPSKYRVPVVLCYLQGLTNAEAAAELGCPPNTVATRLARARERLRGRLTKPGLTAAVSAALVAAAARNATAVVEGSAGASAEIVTLMEGVRSAMMWNKAKIIVATVAILTLTGVGATRFTFRANAEVPAAQAPALDPPQAPKSAPIAGAPAAWPPDRLPAVDVTAAKMASKNFVVTGAPLATCNRILLSAEMFRARIAKQWLGKELPDWPRRCPIAVTLNAAAPASATTFNFGAAPELTMHMTLSGSFDRVYGTCLPHEVTHTILADHFRQPIPRWADEGAALLSEPEEEGQHYHNQTVALLKDGRAIRLASLFGMKDYPSDVGTLYAQGHSVTRFLVERKDRPAFLEFVKIGMKDGWEAAAKKVYDLSSLTELEQAWLDSLRSEAARDKRPAAPPVADPLVSYAPAQVPPPAPPPQDGSEAPVQQDGSPQQATSSAQPPAYTPVPANSNGGLTLVQAVMDKEGFVVVKFEKMTQYEPITTLRQDPNGGVKGITTYLRRTIQEERAYKPEQLRVLDAKGHVVSDKDLVKRLEKETTVLLAADGTFDTRLLPMFKDGTLIVTLNQGEPVAPPPVAPNQPALIGR
ncbi:MAG: RNA polymerase sigma factor [Gemmataceae bacterium]